MVMPLMVMSDMKLCPLAISPNSAAGNNLGTRWPRVL
jgi:hypothetical protein